MSGWDALMDAVRDTIRSAVSLTPGECDVCPDGQPNPAAGQRFVAVHPAAVTNRQVHCLDEYYSFKVTVTKRTAMNPRDRKRDGGVWELAAQVRNAVHMSYAITAAATAAESNASFVEPPVYEMTTYLGPKGPDWFWAEPTGGERDPTGIAVELSFGKCRRVTYIGETST
jgi:hypothetical protein